MSRRQVLERCKHLREDRLRYMQKWGLIHAAHRAHGETFYAFADLAVIRQADAELGEGASFRAVILACSIFWKTFRRSLDIAGYRR